MSALSRAAAGEEPNGPMASDSDRVGPPSGLRTAIWCIAAAAGLLQAWANRFFISPDGNSYLDVASNYLRHDWSNAINGWWSPMMSWLLAGVLYVLKLPGRWESTAIHLLNVAALLVSLWCFEFLMRGLRRGQTTDGSADASTTWWLLGYSLFFSTSFFVLTIDNTTPDVWLAVAAYLATGIVVRIHSGHPGYGWFALLGFILGLGFLFKSFFFPLSLIFLFAAWCATGSPRKNLLKAIVAALAFSLTAGPFIAALSHAKHRLTFGDTGRYAFFMFMSRIQQPPFWQGENGTGTPTHPTRQLMAKPRLFEFATPLNSSYPPLYEMSYWMDGARIRFSLRSQMAVLRQSAGTFYVVLAKQAAFLVGLLTLIFSFMSWPGYFSSLLKRWYVWLPSLLACLAYSIVLTEERYVAPFVLILWIAAFLGVDAAAASLNRRVLSGVALALCTIIGIDVAKASVSAMLAVRSGAESQQNINWDVAQGLHDLGVQPGDRVAVIASKGKAHWARLAGTRIVAEIPLGDESLFWNADAGLRQRIQEIFLSTGSRAIVAESPPGDVSKAGWVQIPRTEYYVYRLR